MQKVKASSPSPQTQKTDFPGRKVAVTKPPMKVFKDEMSNGKGSALKVSSQKAFGALPYTLTDIPKSPSIIVEDLYKKLLNREPDGGGLEFWTAKGEGLRAQGATPEAIEQMVTEGIEGSLEYRLNQPEKFVDDLYQELLGRSADGEGLATWTGQIAQWNSEGAPYEDIEKGLRGAIEGSPEFQAKNAPPVAESGAVGGELAPSDQELAGRVNANLEGTGLAGKGEAIVAAARKYKVPVDFAMAQLQKESSFLSKENNLSVANNNPGNLRFAEWERELGGVPGAGNFTHFPSVEKGIEAQIRLLGSDFYRKDVDARDWKSLVYKYCPPSDQPGGAADTDLYVKQMYDWTKNWQGKLGVDSNWVNAPPAGATAPSSARPAPATPAGRDLRGITPSQANATQFSDQWSLCGPIAATAMCKAFGKDVSIAQARQVGLNGGNYTTNGMLGAASEVRMLKDLGITTHLESPVNFEKVKAELAAGRPVIVSTPNHYFVIEGYDPATGKFDCGNSALAMKASHGQTLMTPQDFVNWGGGAATAIVAG